MDYKTNTMLLEVAQDYYRLIENMPALIDASGYRNDFLASKLGIKPQTFSAKKINGSWNRDELFELLKLLSTDDVEDYYLGVMMEHVSKKPEDLVSLDEFKQLPEWK